MRTQHTNHGAFLGATQQTLFQLPPPPPGMQWHRTDGWEDGDLPEGWRPLVYGETRLVGDEFFPTEGCDTWRNKWQTAEEGFRAQPQNSVNKGSYKSRTRRPLTFTHAGKTWTWHRPGDPMPCDSSREVFILCQDEELWSPARRIKSFSVQWEVCACPGYNVIGWRYADEKKTVPLGPEDVPPCCAFRRQNESSDYIMPTSVYVGGIYGHDEIVFRHTWEYLKEHYQINRSLPLTGKWNPDAWEPCSKEVLA